MQIHSMDKKEEPLLSRTMLKVEISFDKATPSYQEVTASLATHAKADEKLIAIKHIYTLFGSKKAEVTAYLYADEAKKQLIEPKVKAKKEKKAKTPSKK